MAERSGDSVPEEITSSEGGDDLEIQVVSSVRLHLHEEGAAVARKRDIDRRRQGSRHRLRPE